MEGEEITKVSVRTKADNNSRKDVKRLEAEKRQKIYKATKILKEELGL